MCKGDSQLEGNVQPSLFPATREWYRKTWK